MKATAVMASVLVTCSLVLSGCQTPTGPTRPDAHQDQGKVRRPEQRAAGAQQGTLEMKKLFLAIFTLMLSAMMLSGCVGGRTEADPSKHPDAWERKQERQLMRRAHRERHRN